jgi:predicted HTH domain antitoxin
LKGKGDFLMDFISFRASKDFKKQIDVLSELENKKKSEEYRDVFLVGLTEKKKEMAVRRYQNGDFSLGKASEFAGITNWEFLQLLKQKNVPMNLSAEEVFKGVASV